MKEAERARDFAKTYVSLVEALMREGVTEDVARHEARVAAFARLNENDIVLTYDPAKGPCPTCKNG